MKVFNEDVSFLGTVIFSQLPIPASTELSDTTTPNVSNLIVLLGSGLIVTITNFIGGVDSQTIRILGDGSTTIQNNLDIITNTGANKLLTLNKFYCFTYISSLMQWIEDA